MSTPKFTSTKALFACGLLALAILLTPEQSLAGYTHDCSLSSYTLLNLWDDEPNVLEYTLCKILVDLGVCNEYVHKTIIRKEYFLRERGILPPLGLRPWAEIHN